MTPATPPIVAVHEVHKFAPRSVSVSMDAAKGGVVCIIGPSRVGQIDAAAMYQRLGALQRGNIRVGGFDVPG